MRTLLGGVLVAIMMLSGICSVVAEKNTCKRCGTGSTAIVIVCDGPVKDAIVKINSINRTDASPSKTYYEWRGDLETGDNTIPFKLFTSEEGRRFNPNEFAVNNIMLTNKAKDDFTFFNLTKD